MKEQNGNVLTDRVGVILGCKRKEGRTNSPLIINHPQWDPEYL